MKQHLILVCNSSNPKIKGVGCCYERDSDDVLEKLESLISEFEDEENEILVKKMGCTRHCAEGVTVKMNPGNRLYLHVTPRDAYDLLKAQVVDKQPYARLYVEEE